jgi:Baseplate J-like protein
MIYSCCNENRKAAILNNPGLKLNGIDYLEVLDSEAVQLGLPPQQTLLVHCLTAAPLTLVPTNILITGGESITGITAVWITTASSPPASLTKQAQDYFQSLPDAVNVLVVSTNQAGDFSTYTLRLVSDAEQASQDPFEVTEVLTGFDSQLADVQFSFKVECRPNFDCQPQTPNCPPPEVTPPAINYLAKDYGSFRQIMLDRLSQLLPSWTPSTEADLGIVLAELIAYVGDNLSYQQDAIATEAYLETARSRVSLRRHALLVDYHVHDGCNARAWIQLQVAGNPGDQIFLDHALTRFYGYAPGMPPSLAVGAGNEEAALLAGVTVFEPMQDAELHPEHNQMSFYTWGDTNCCLPMGATEATLLGSFPNLQPADVLIFQEVKGPQTGEAGDADIRHRCAVRLTQVATQSADGSALSDPLFSDPDGNPTPVTEIQWSQEDALPFPVCVSSGALDSQGNPITDVSVVFGNVVLADHGLSFSGISLPTVLAPRLFYPRSPSANRCQPVAPIPIPVRYRPTIPEIIPGTAVTQAVPLPLAGNPVTPGIVMLSGTGLVSLTDSNGFVCLMIEANPFDWPQFFGVLTKANAVNPGNFDLSVVYNPPGGAANVPSPVTLETFTNLSLTPSDANYVATQINRLSQFVLTPSSYIPPRAAPSGFPATPTNLPNTGSVNLLDTSKVPYLTLQANSFGSWPQNFGVVSQDLQTEPPAFNLILVYNPPSGGVGLNLPITVEQQFNVSLTTVATQFGSASELITVRSFAQAPNPSLSATALTNLDASEAVPLITLTDNASNTWTPAPDLLENGASDRVFVVEVESDGTARLRFGDNVNGQTPAEGTSFIAAYRVGNGTAGKVGADSLVYLAAADARIQSCRNPLPAGGGTDPETEDQIRRRAPQAFLTQERSINMTDYENVAELNPQVDRAVASLRWTGSWYTVFVAVEPDGGGNLSPALQQTLTASEELYRLAGQDLLLDSPQYVSLEIILQICVDPSYFQSYVQQSLLQVLGTGVLPNGTNGFFNPDNFTFGQTVYLSQIYAAARSVPGVTTVTALTFQPQGVNTTQYLLAGEIKLGSLQVARLASDPNFPDHGQLTLVMEGGK